MKRDIEIIRSILIKLEEFPEFSPIYNFSISGFSEDELIYHLILLQEAKYLIANFNRLGSGKYLLISVERLTYEGHDLLDALKNKDVWNQFTNYLRDESKELGSFPITILFELFKKFAINWGEKKLGLKPEN